MTNQYDSYLQSLLVTWPLRMPVLLSAIEVVLPKQGSRGVDVGCGVGSFAQLLADRVGPDGHVTGLDVSQEFLSYARRLARDAGLEARVSFRQGNARSLPFDDNSLDWAWSVDCVGYGRTNSPALIGEMARVVRPGGVIAILAWASERLLPGHPMLEARLGTTAAGLAPFSAGMAEDMHLSRGMGWFKQVGLDAPSARALAGSACAPLTDELRAALAALLEMRWPGVDRELDQLERAEFHRLCDPGSADFILDQSDYYAFFTYTMLWATAPR